jgi:hypothetical protein
MEDLEKAAFIKVYTKVLTQSWSNEEFAQQLQSNPQRVLTDLGLAMPPGSIVKVTHPDDGVTDLGLQLSAWAEGMTTGSFILSVPGSPHHGARQLSDADLGDLAGGVLGFSHLASETEMGFTTG